LAPKRAKVAGRITPPEFTRFSTEAHNDNTSALVCKHPKGMGKLREVFRIRRVEMHPVVGMLAFEL
jgi:hypothetical protein